MTVLNQTRELPAYYTRGNVPTYSNVVQSSVGLHIEIQDNAWGSC